VKHSQPKILSGSSAAAGIVPIDPAGNLDRFAALTCALGANLLDAIWRASWSPHSEVPAFNAVINFLAAHTHGQPRVQAADLGSVKAVRNTMSSNRSRLCAITSVRNRRRS
jgi:hypothetical protein